MHSEKGEMKKLKESKRRIRKNPKPSSSEGLMRRLDKNKK